MPLANLGLPIGVSVALLCGAVKAKNKVNATKKKCFTTVQFVN
jgi:hypothetical protein